MEFMSLCAQSCPTLYEPMDCSPLGSSIHGILQARILARVTIPFSRGSCQPRDQNQVSCIAGRFCTVWATREEWSQYIIWTYPYQIPNLIFLLYSLSWSVTASSSGHPSQKLTNSSLIAFCHCPNTFNMTKSSQISSISNPSSTLSPLSSTATGDWLELTPEADTTGCIMFWQPQRMVWRFQAAFSFLLFISFSQHQVLVAARMIF